MTIDDLEENKYYLTPEDENYANAFGDGHVFRRAKRKVKKKIDKFKKKQAQDQKVQDEQIAKLKEADANDTSMQDALKAMGDVPVEEKKGLSIGVKIGIGVAIALAVGVGIYIYKKRKKK